MKKHLFAFLAVILVSLSCFYNLIAQDPVPSKVMNGGLVSGKAISLRQPEYPIAAIGVRAGGAVDVNVVINEEGNVESATASSGHPLLRVAAEKAALASKFSPTKVSGEPVKVRGVIVYVFSPPTPRPIYRPIDRTANLKRLNEKAISLPEPIYNNLAFIDLRKHGPVAVEVIVNKKGRVISAKALSDVQIMRAVTEEAALRAKFSPRDVKGKRMKGILVYFPKPKEKERNNLLP